MEKNTKGRGRKQGSINRMTQQTKRQLSEVLLPHLRRLSKILPVVEPERRLSFLGKCLPYFLSKGKVSNEETEVQKILYEQLLPYYKKMNVSFKYIPEEQRPKVLLQFLKMLTPKQISAIAPTINEKVKSPGINRKKRS